MANKTVSLYKGQVEIIFQESVHRYKVNGSYVPGVSTVLGILHKELTDWAAWMAVEAFKEAVMDVATTENKMTKTELKSLADSSKKAHRRKSDRGKDVGTIVHGIIADITEKALANGGNLDGVNVELNLDFDDETNIQVKNCIEQWMKWVKTWDVEFIKSEEIVYSKMLGYCGTYDVLFRSRRTGKVYLGDYKTSEPQKIRNSKYVVTGTKAYPEHFVQISAYDWAMQEEHGTKVDGYAVLYLPKDGEYAMFTREHPETDRISWSGLFRTYQWLDSIKKGKEPTAEDVFKDLKMEVISNG